MNKFLRANAMNMAFRQNISIPDVQGIVSWNARLTLRLVYHALRRFVMMLHEHHQSQSRPYSNDVMTLITLI